MRPMNIMSMNEAVEALKSGKVGVIPTDTVYGLAARAADPAAVERLYALKRRERKPGTVIAASVKQLIGLGVEERALRRVEHLWPNSLSVETPLGEQLAYLHQGTGHCAWRVPADENLRKTLEQTGPLATSSANQPGEPPAVNVDEAQRYFGDAVDFYVDGGNLSGRQPSTVIRIVDDEIVVAREGAVKTADLKL